MNSRPLKFFKVFEKCMVNVKVLGSSGEPFFVCASNQHGTQSAGVPRK